MFYKLIVTFSLWYKILNLILGTIGVQILLDIYHQDQHKIAIVNNLQIIYINNLCNPKKIINFH